MKILQGFVAIFLATSVTISLQAMEPEAVIIKNNTTSWDIKVTVHSLWKKAGSSDVMELVFGVPNIMSILKPGDK